MRKNLTLPIQRQMKAVLRRIRDYADCLMPKRASVAFQSEDIWHSLTLKAEGQSTRGVSSEPLAKNEVAPHGRRAAESDTGVVCRDMSRLIPLKCISTPISS